MSEAVNSEAVENTKPIVFITGSGGLIGQRLVKALEARYRVVGFDKEPPERYRGDEEYVEVDLTDDAAVASAFREAAERFGTRVSSVLHLAAYYDFSGEASPLYEELTVDGTRRLLGQLNAFQVEQFVFSSSLLVMDTVEEGERLTEQSPTKAEWRYPQSKLRTEQLIRDEAQMPAVILRIAGVYDEMGHSLPIGQQIKRIHTKQLQSYFFPGNREHGQSFVHLKDLADCFVRVVDKRHELSDYEVFLIGEEDVMSYEELQDAIGELIHGREWRTLRIPKPVAKVGAWAQGKMADEGEQPFIKPWMVDLADQNYPVSNQYAGRLLGWTPEYTLRGTLPAIVENLKKDPKAWYQANGISLPEDEDA